MARSHGDLKDLGMALLGFGIHDSQPADDRFPDVRFGFCKGFALTEAPRKRRDFRNVVARLVTLNHDV